LASSRLDATLLALSSGWPAAATAAATPATDATAVNGVEFIAQQHKHTGKLDYLNLL